jgi:hypothetical protein
MSENLDLVRSLYVARARGDFSLAEWAHPRIEFVLADGPTRGSATGLAAMARAWGEFFDVLQDHHIRPVGYRELDDERVLVLTRRSARRKLSQLELPTAWTKGLALYTIRSGKVVRLLVYMDRQRGLANLGLPG